MSSIKILLDQDGHFQEIHRIESEVATLVLQKGPPWNQPIVVHGPDYGLEIEALLRDRRTRIEWFIFQKASDLSKFQRYQSTDISLAFDRRGYEDTIRASIPKINQILSGARKLDDIVGIISESMNLYAVSGDVSGSVISQIERLCNSGGVVVNAGVKNSLLHVFVAAIWLRRSRQYPLVMYGPREVAIAGVENLNVATGRFAFTTLLNEVETALGLSPSETEHAYRVWQMSRSDVVKKSSATTPKYVNLEVAQNFLAVLTRAGGTDRSLKWHQSSAPIIFEPEGDIIDLKSGVRKSASDDVVAKAVESLLRRVNYAVLDYGITNVVPNARGILTTIHQILLRFEGLYSDGDVVELGLELVALEWSIDGCKALLSAPALASCMSLFASSHMLMERFEAWGEFKRVEPKTTDEATQSEAYQISRDLLWDARKRPFLTNEASDRIDEVLNRVGRKSEAPSLREGLVRSGENLASITAEAAGRIISNEARAAGDEVKKSLYGEAGKALIGFAAKHGPAMVKLAQLRGWAWLAWLQLTLDQAGGGQGGSGS